MVVLLLFITFKAIVIYADEVMREITIVNVIVEVIIVKNHLVKREVFELTAKEE